jgi:hypothetical protein
MLVNVELSPRKEVMIMSEYQDTLQQLKDMHEILQNKNLECYSLTREMCESMDKDNYIEMVNGFNVMETNGWIKKFGDSKTHPISYAITPLGFSVLK